MLHHIPNFISIVRITLVAPLVVYLWTDRYVEALVVLVVAAVSDAVDGGLARGFKWHSRLGEILDPLADKLLVLTMVLVLLVKGLFPVWLVVVVMLRDAIITFGASAWRLLFSHFEAEPSVLSKINTVAQLVLLVVMLVVLSELPAISDVLRPLIDPWMFLIVGVLSIWSGIDYVLVWSRRAIRKHGRHTDA